MSGMHGGWGTFRSNLGDLVGMRAGIALDNDRLDSYLSRDSKAPSPDTVVRIDPTDFQDALFSALRDCGSTWSKDGAQPRITAWQNFKKDTQLYIAAHDLIHQEIHNQNIEAVYADHTPDANCRLPSADGHPQSHGFAAYTLSTVDSFIAGARLDTLNPAKLDDLAYNAGRDPLVYATRALTTAFRAEQHLDPWSRCTVAAAGTIAELSDLFKKSDTPARDSNFFDQRFIDFLSANLDDVPKIHWRQFERLVAEYFDRQGHFVELGPGSNDDGVDIRVWPMEKSGDAPPLLIIQCKRQKEKVEKVVVKGLWADMQAEGAARGLVATTKSVSRGAKATILGRGYCIDSADFDSIASWLEAMRTPGAGPTLL